MSEWRQTTIAELAGHNAHALATGPFGSAISSKHFVDQGVPVLRGTNLSLDVGVRLQDQGLVYLSREKADTFRRSIARRGDLVFTCWGTVGQVGLVDHRSAFTEYIVSNKQMKLTPDARKASSLFLYYLLSSPAMVQEVRNQSIGAAVPGFNLGQLRQIRLRLPPVEVQETIAGILASLDDLIENNRRRSELLEQMAQVIYREWFVRFRYRGHEEVSLAGSSLGPIPADWTVSTCGEMLTILGGGTPSKKEPAYWTNGTIPWYTPSDLTKSRARFAAEPELMITALGLQKSSARLFPAGSILMTSRATLGVLAIATTDAACNQGFIVIPPDDRWPPTFIYEWLRDRSSELEALGTGATFKEITKGAFKRFPFLVPAPKVLSAFRDIVTPIEGEVRVLEESNRNLTMLRDLLLPKLVTGRIDVSNLDLDALVEAAG